MSASSVTGTGQGSAPRYDPSNRQFMAYLQALTENISIRITSSLVGEINGTNRIFLLEEVGLDVFLFKNGIMQTLNVDYDVSDDGMTITFHEDNIPQINDVLTARISKNLIESLGLPPLGE